MDAASKALGPLLARSPLVGTGRVARTISILVGTFFFAGRSWEAVGGFVASGATPLVVFTSFSTTPDYLTTSERLSEEVSTLAGLAFPSSATSRAVLVLELARLDARMARG